eukprot:Clim_evm22s77 gene=Clim_evmTU22s77
MRYCSTRGGSAGRTFEEVVLEGLCDDGGLYVPESIPSVSYEELTAWRGLCFQDLAVKIWRKYISEEEIPTADLAHLAQKSYSTFRSKLVTPVKHVSGLKRKGNHRRPADDQIVLELFHGPTFAFKDVALQFLGSLFEYLLKRHPGRHMTIVGATSGDTGSAAIYGVRGKENIDVYMLHPSGRVAPIQERQMTTVLDDNIHNIGIDGIFDDCQNIVKELFGDLDFKRSQNLGAVNSINWARILAQIVYYFHAYNQMCDSGDVQFGNPVVFTVPTGNFGDVLAGYYAKQMGLPISRLIVATNHNDILHRMFSAGDYSIKKVVPSLAPAMDISISSNFERYLYMLCDHDSAQLKELMDIFKATGRLTVTPQQLQRAQSEFDSFNANTNEIVKTIRRYYREAGYLLCPHSAIGVYATEKYQERRDGTSNGTTNGGSHGGQPICTLLTAHPGKFQEATERAIPGEHVPLPPQLAELMKNPTRCLRVGAISAEDMKEVIRREEHGDIEYASPKGLIPQPLMVLLVGAGIAVGLAFGVRRMLR